jgi:Zn-dependent M28 family amino/carboxypeptidase
MEAGPKMERRIAALRIIEAIRMQAAFDKAWPDSLEKVTQYIIREFSDIGFDCEEQKWNAAGNEYVNVIASYNKHKTKRLIVGAHYDVCGDQPGADDNASAVAGLLETARMVAENKPDLDYRIDFVAYCLEEPPFFGTPDMGSFVHAKSLHDQQVDVIGMICYEMIGYFSDLPNSQPYPSPELEKLYPSIANFIIVVGIQKYHDFNMKIHGLMKSQSKIDVQVISFPTKDDLAGLSDHRNYWHFGYNALMINDTSFLRNPNYHQQLDTIETLDFDKMAAVIVSSYHAVVNII